MLKVGSKDTNGSANTDSKVLIKSTVLDTNVAVNMFKVEIKDTKMASSIFEWISHIVLVFLFFTLTFTGVSIFTSKAG